MTTTFEIVLVLVMLWCALLIGADQRRRRWELAAVFAVCTVAMVAVLLGVPKP